MTLRSKPHLDRSSISRAAAIKSVDILIHRTPAVAPNCSRFFEATVHLDWMVTEDIVGFLDPRPIQTAARIATLGSPHN